jgi:hypothetical protein
MNDNESIEYKIDFFLIFYFSHKFNPEVLKKSV